MIRELLDEEGENLAVRSFLMQYSCDRAVTVGAMLAHMNRSGWREAAPEFALSVRPETHLTKAGAQIWIRHLFSLESAAPTAGEASARTDESCLPPFAEPASHPKSLLRAPISAANPLPPGCYCKPGECGAPKPNWCRDAAKRDFKAAQGGKEQG